MFDVITTLLTSVYRLTAKLGKAHYVTPAEIAETTEVWTRMGGDAQVCRMALIGSEHLSDAELRHFSACLDDIGQLKQTNAGNADYQQLTNFKERHADFLKIVAENRKAAVAAITSVA